MEDSKQNVINTIKSVYPTLYDAERRAGEFILNYYTEVINMTITELAEKTEVSDATIVRLCKKLGFKGFHHFKIALAQEIVQPTKEFTTTISLDNIKDSVHNIFMHKIEEFKQTENFLDVNIVKQCLEIIKDCNCLYLFAVGNSLPVALDAAYKFSQIGIRTIVNNTPEMQVSSAYSMTEQDVALGISHSGSSKLLLLIFEIAQQRKAKTICITNYIRSPLAQISDYQLNTVNNSEVFYDGFDYTRIPETSIVDVLFLLLAKMYLKDSRQAIGDRELSLSEYKF